MKQRKLQALAVSLGLCGLCSALPAGAATVGRVVAVGEDGRAGDSTADPLTTITMSSETFARLGSGREPLDTFEVSVTGDAALAARVLASLNVTP